MISLAYINVLSIIDGDIVINETIYNDVYKYVDKIVKVYSILPLTIYLQLTLFDNIIYIKLFDNQWSTAIV